MKPLTTPYGKQERGFSMLELMVSVALMSVIMGAVLSQITLIQQRARTEEVKVDIFQSAREFGDQIERDLHQAGYPTIRMFNTSAPGWTTAWASPTYNDSRVAVGITLIGPSEIKFEGDVDGTGNVSIVDYQLVSTGNNCPCLQRSQVLKSTGGSAFSNELQNVQSAGTSSDPIFVGYTATGTAVTSADMTGSAGRTSLATVKTIQWQIKLKAPIVDPTANIAPETTLHGQAIIQNCSLADSNQSNSC